MRVNELKPEDIHVGMKIRSLKNPNKLATVVDIDHADDDFAWIQWEGDDKPYSGFYGNNCSCEVVNES